MVVSQYNSKFSNKLNGSFYWFKRVLLSRIKEKMREFILSDFDLKLVGITEQDNVFFVGEEYFVTRIKTDKKHEVFFRISAPFMDIILEKGLGESSEVFVPENMTELEATILTKLNDYIFKGISQFFVNGEDIVDENQNFVHLTMIAKSEKGFTGKYIVSVPISLIPDIRALSTKQHFDLGSFGDYKVEVKIITGKSQITLYDVRHIESGDIVVLEDSNIKTMSISLNGQTRKFMINPETSIIVGVDNDEGEAMENNNSSGGTMWDVIPVDITAEFEKVTITLGELKQISEGVIVDVGSLYENKVVLKVENKPVASGELVIINDKYAVRVDEVFSDMQPAAATPAATPAPATGQAPRPAAAPARNVQQASPAQDAKNDDFNYEDFDIEDEDI